MTAWVVRRAVLAAAVLGVLVVPGCGKRKAKTAEDRAFLSADVLYARGIQQIAEDNLAKAREDLERIQFTAENLPVLEPLVKLRLADVTFYRGDDLSLIDARQKYLDFVIRHADHPLGPYAQFQAGVCSLKQVGHWSKDQSQTHVALDDFREVLRRYPGTDYARAARGVISEANSYLARHEFMVARFYFKKKAYPASIRRCRKILDSYPRFEDEDTVLLLLGQALVLDDRETEGRAYLDRLVQDYPDGDVTREARKFLSEHDARARKSKSDAGNGPGVGEAGEADAT